MKELYIENDIKDDCESNYRNLHPQSRTKLILLLNKSDDYN